MVELIFLQSYVVPVVAYRETEQGVVIARLFGTAFLIGNQGAFITASHVLASGYSAIKGTDQVLGVVGKEAGGGQVGSVAGRITHHQTAPGGADIAVGLTGYRSASLLRLSRRNPTVWADVATYGYPQEALSGPADGLMLNLRAHKGYIQRELRKGDVFAKPHAEGFELSFLLAGGMSGSPLFFHAGDYDEVIGVCTGSIRSETIEETHREVRADGTIYEEISLSVSQFGIAEAIGSLLDWQPDCFSGQTLATIGEGL